jgi:hypothetical protein
MTKASDKKLLEAMEKGVIDVLENEKSTAKEKLEAVNVGAKLMQIKHKINDNPSEPGSFFNRG